MNTEKLRRYAYIIIVAVGVLILGFITVKYLLPIILPFLLGWGVALCVRPLSRWLSARLKLSERVISPIIAVVLIITLVVVVSAVVVAAATEGWSLLSGLIADGRLEELISNVINPISSKLEGVYSEEIKAHVSEAVGSVFKSALTALGSFLTGAAARLPSIFLFVIISIISCVYFCADLDNINHKVLRLLPKRASDYILRFKASSLGVLLKYIRGGALIMLITFMIMLVGFIILGINYAFLLSIIVALLDALPILGVGTFLVPFSVISFIRGDVSLGVGLLVLLLMHELIRQIIEPKILGKSLGVHPILTLIFIYAGFSLFGFFGMLLLPIFVIVMNTLAAKKDAAEVKE